MSGGIKIKMSNEEYVRSAAQKYKWKRYYLTQRPVSIGTQPRDLQDFINYDDRKEVNGHMVWAECYYEIELSAEELQRYDMIKGD